MYVCFTRIFERVLLQVLGAYMYERWDDKILQSTEKRLFMIPAILLIVFIQHPFHTRIISEIIIFLQTSVLGVTNGIAGSVPMIFAPSQVPEERRELAGEYIHTHICDIYKTSVYAYSL